MENILTNKLLIAGDREKRRVKRPYLPQERRRNQLLWCIFAINLHESLCCYKPLDSDKPVVETGKMVENLPTVGRHSLFLFMCLIFLVCRLGKQWRCLSPGAVQSCPSVHTENMRQTDYWPTLF